MNRIESFSQIYDAPAERFQRSAYEIGCGMRILIQNRAEREITLREWHFMFAEAVQQKNVVFSFDSSSTPIGYALWARVEENTDIRVRLGKKTLLHPCEWNEGEIPWIIDSVTPTDLSVEIINEVCARLQVHIDELNWLENK